MKLVYVRAPNDKPDILELRDTNGEILQPIKGKMDNALPQKIPAKDLLQGGGLWEKLRGGRGNNDAGYKYFLLGDKGDPPNILNTFSMNDTYRIKNEADYILTASPVIYKFETNYHYVDRIDLPAVKMKIHLYPSP